MKYHYWLALRPICREEPAPTDPPADPPKDQSKTFTQDEVNALLAKEKRAAQQKIQEQLKTLETIQRDGLSPESKQALEQQIEALRAQSQTEVELAKQKLTKQQKAWEEERTKLKAERDAARNRHEQLEIDTILMTAMGMHGVRPTATPIVKPYLLQRLKANPVLDSDGKPTDQVQRIIQLEVPDDEDPSKIKVLQLPPDKAVAHLRDLPDFSGLFASAATSGTGSSKTTNTGEPDFKNMTQADYMEWRKQQKSR